MAKIEYPLLCYRLTENAYLGILVGNNLEAIADNPKTLKSMMREKLDNAEKNDEYYYGWNVRSLYLKPFRVVVRPAFKGLDYYYPLKEMQSLDLFAIVGQHDDGMLSVEIPGLCEKFLCQETSTLNELMEYLALNELQRMSPEQIFRIKGYGLPELESISMTIKSSSKKEKNFPSKGPRLNVLKRYAEQMPASLPTASFRSGSLMDTAWGMEEAVKNIVDVIQSDHGNVIVVGNAGSGKSTAILAAIRQITKRSDSGEQKPTFWRIQAQKITAGGKYLGDWQQTCNELVSELTTVQGALWVTDTAQLLKSGGRSPQESTAAFLQSFIREGQLKMIGEVTPEELFSMRRQLSGFAELFHLVFMPDPPEAKVQAILDQFAAAVQQKHKITITPDTLRLTYRMLSRYYPYEAFPGKGIRLLSKCLKQAIEKGMSTIDSEVVISSFAEATGFPEVFLRDDLALDLDDLSEFFQSRIKGQQPAVNRLCQVVKVFKTGLNNPRKPIAVLLFAGPTGVGKTAAAKALAEYFFGHGKTQTPLVRMDMSEFQSAAHLSRLIGDGDEPGQLVREIRERPFSVLLLDEIEKADDAIFDALLSTLDEGTLTDSFGRMTDFRNCIIIMTTNLGADGIPSIGFNSTHQPDDNTRMAVNRRFRPEFVNRIDDTVVFTALQKPHIREIAIRELQIFAKREGFVSRNLSLEFTDKLVDYLAETGFDPVYGARPLQRTLERLVAAPTAAWLLKHPNLQGASLVLDYSKELEIKRV